METMNSTKTKAILLILSFSFLLVDCSSEKKEEPATKVVDAEPKVKIPEISYTLGQTFPHDSTSFTEGLLFHDNELLESTGSPQGSNFKSVFGIVDTKTGKINVKAALDTSYFGEGIVVLKNKLYQVTYEDQVGFIYDAKTYRKIGQFNYTNKQGWGMTTDGKEIIMSDGTEVLTFFDSDFKPTRTLTVKEGGYAKENLNELEFINGFIYANIWLTSDVVKIDPKSGEVVGRLNFTPVSYEVKNFHPYALEMNGIAYDAANDKIYLTGKAWPKIYEVKFSH
jgi:glutamine cyclotransferase